MEISKTQLSNLLAQAAELGAMTALSKTGVIKPFVKRSDAFRMYGRGTIERWVKEGLITPIKDGEASAAWRLDRVELENVARTSNRHTYLSTEERKLIKL